MGVDCLLELLTENAAVWQVLFGIICWCVLYRLLRINIFPNQSSEFSSRVVAATHGLIVTPLAYMCYREGPNPFDDGAGIATFVILNHIMGEPNTELHKLTLKISLSYFLYDFFWCLYYGSEPLIMIIHHVSSIGSIAVILWKGESGAEAVIGLGTMEASNPYLQLRWFLRTLGYNNTPLHTFVELYFFTSFLVLRLGFGTKLMYCILKSPNVTYGVKSCTLVLYLISLAFVFYIYQYIKKKYFKRCDSKSSTAVDEELKKDL